MIGKRPLEVHGERGPKEGSLCFVKSKATVYLANVWGGTELEGKQGIQKGQVQEIETRKQGLQGQ